MQEQEFIIRITPWRRTAWRIGQQFFGNTDDAEDIAQETMMRLWAARNSIDTTRPMESLVVRVAKNVCVSTQRGRSSHLLPLDTMVQSSQEGADYTSPQSLLEERENAVWLEHRLKALPEYLLRILRMKQEEQLTDQQIADILGTDIRSVQTLISKARHQLFNDLKRRHRNENK